MEFPAGAFHLSARIQSCKSHVGYGCFKAQGRTFVDAHDRPQWHHPALWRARRASSHRGREAAERPADRSIRAHRMAERVRCYDRSAKPTLADMPHRPPINQAIGYAHYHEAITDQETRRTLEEALFVEVVVEEWMLNDLWSAVRVPGLVIRQISLGLFGENLLEVDDFRGITYHWLRHQTGRFGSIYVADFRYSTETVHSR